MIGKLGVEKVVGNVRRGRRGPYKRGEEQPIDGGEDCELDRDKDQHIAPDRPRKNRRSIAFARRMRAPAKGRGTGQPGEVHAAAPFCIMSLRPRGRRTNATIAPGFPC